MVKRQREKLYQSNREQRSSAQIRSGNVPGAGTVQRQLPFSHCALSLTAYETPVCNRDGIVFENSALLPFVMKHKMDPVTGKPMTTRDVITLNMAKDEEGRWMCPVLTKPFANHTKIIAILQPPQRTEANVLSYEAYNELNVKAKNYEDLISGIKFDKNKDVLVLNDPSDEDLNRRRDINRFYHVLNAREIKGKEETNKGDIRQSVTASRIMEQLQKKKETEPKPDASSGNNAQVSKEDELTFLLVDGKKLPILAADVTGVEYSSGEVASSFTSTASAVAHDNLQRRAKPEEVRQAQFRLLRKKKKKGYVRLRTSHGTLALELHCDIVPRTCTNFLGLCEAGKYDNTTFHRLIKSFMIQGGKSLDDNDESLWGPAFADEFDPRLKHEGRGILSMANSGKRTNKQQFFLTFRSCPHLDRKHTVFGKVVEGKDEEVLKKLEQIPTDKKERPVDEIKILSVEILQNPCKEVEMSERKRIEKLLRERMSGMKGHSKDPAQTTAPRQTVGKYLKAKLNAASSSKKTKVDETSVPSRLPPPPKKTKFGDFSGW